jgi:hypothetical protein
MNKKIIAMALVGFAASSVHAFTVKASELDDWGMSGSAIVAPDSDVFSGGTSETQDAMGTCLGKCASGDNWSIATALDGTAISSKIKVTAYVPSSAAGWGWANAGWWVIPNTKAKTDPAMSWFESSDPIGLTSASTLTIGMSYTAGSKLTIQFAGAGIDVNDGNQSPPRYVYTGKGAVETVTVPVSMVKRASWSSPKDYNAGGVNAIGFLRIVAAGAQGAAFPATEPATTDFKLVSVSSDGVIPVLGGFSNGVALNSTGSNVELVGLNGQASSIELLNSVGQVVASDKASISTAELQSGVYFVRATVDGQSLVRQIAK